MAVDCCCAAAASSYSRWLMARSHAVYALRRWRHAGVEVVDRGFASEGTWKDLVHSGAQAGERHADAHEQSARAQSERAEKLREYNELYRELGGYTYDRDPGRPGWYSLVPNER